MSHSTGLEHHLGIYAFLSKTILRQSDPKIYILFQSLKMYRKIPVLIHLYKETHDLFLIEAKFLKQKNNQFEF